MARVKEPDIDYNDRCYETGIFNDRCDCSTCEHKYECSGSDDDEED